MLLFYIRLILNPNYFVVKDDLPYLQLKYTMLNVCISSN